MPALDGASRHAWFNYRLSTSPHSNLAEVRLLSRCKTQNGDCTIFQLLAVV